MNMTENISIAIFGARKTTFTHLGNLITYLLTAKSLQLNAYDLHPCSCKWDFRVEYINPYSLIEARNRRNAMPPIVGMDVQNDMEGVIK